MTSKTTDKATNSDNIDPKAAEHQHSTPDLPKDVSKVPATQDGQPDSVKSSGKAGRDAQPINQNLPQAQGARQADRGGKK